MNVVRVGVGFAFFCFFYDVIAQTMSGFMCLKFVWILGCRLIRVFRALDRLPSVSDAKVMSKRPHFFQELPRGLVEISLINFCLFFHKFWTRNARKSIKPPKDSYCSLESTKFWATKSGRLVDSQEKMMSSKCKQICINIVPLCKRQQKNDISSLHFFSLNYKTSRVSEGFVQLSSTVALKVFFTFLP